MLPGAGYINMNIAADGTRIVPLARSCIRLVATELDGCCSRVRS